MPRKRTTKTPKARPAPRRQKNGGASKANAPFAFNPADPELPAPTELSDFARARWKRHVAALKYAGTLGHDVEPSLRILVHLEEQYHRLAEALRDAPPIVRKTTQFGESEAPHPALGKLVSVGGALRLQLEGLGLGPTSRKRATAAPDVGDEDDLAAGDWS